MQEFKMSKQLSEQEQLDEALFGGLGVALLAKLIMILSQKQNIRKILDALRSRQGELPEEAGKIFDAIDGAIDTVEENLPKAVRGVTDANGKWNPHNWASNLLVAILSKVIKKDTAEPTEEPDEDLISTAKVAPVKGELQEMKIKTSQLYKIIQEELETLMMAE